MIMKQTISLTVGTYEKIAQATISKLPLSVKVIN